MDIRNQHEARLHDAAGDTKDAPETSIERVASEVIEWNAGDLYDCADDFFRQWKDCHKDREYSDDDESDIIGEIQDQLISAWKAQRAKEVQS